jgi:hypothetical protein
MEQQLVNHEVETRVQAWRWPDSEIVEAPRKPEPKFHLYPPVKVTLLDDPEAELDCLLTDISLSDVKILAGESLTEDEIIVIELEDSFLLADVRYSQRRKDKFAIGAARMHTLQKFAAPRDASKIEMLEALIGDFHAQCVSQIEKIRDAIHSLQIQSRMGGARPEPAAVTLTVPVAPLAFNEPPARPKPAPRPEPGIVEDSPRVQLAEPVEPPEAFAPPGPFEVVGSYTTSKALREVLDLLRKDLDGPES